MNPSPENRDQPLERLIHQTLRDLPAHRAPRTLEGRVLAELARRAALPWWHQPYAHWPVAVRGVFFVVTAATAAVIIAAVFYVMRSSLAAEAVGEVRAGFEWLTFLRALATNVAEKGATIFRAIPPLWLYGAFALIAAGYATLVGMGAVAYRALRPIR